MGMNRSITPKDERWAELAQIMERHTGKDGAHSTPISGLRLFRASAPSEPIHAIYEPSLCLVAQGDKQLMLGEDIFRYNPWQCLLASVDLPIVGQVTSATPETPYLGMSLSIDPGEIAALIVEASDLPAPRVRHSGRGLSVSPIATPLLDAILRLLRLLDTPPDIRVLAPLAMREILYRLLTGEQGAHLRQIASGSDHTQRVAAAISWLKRNYAQPFRIETLAREANMGSSNLHQHFKAVTAMSPLQYQKQLRLQEARRLMLGEAMDASTASFQVGYESPTQFSREYSRLFGAPPLRDIARLRGLSQGGLEAAL